MGLFQGKATALRVQLDDNLRALLKAGRKRAGNLTQGQAAAQTKPRISMIWWAQLESGTKNVTRVDTFISMVEALGIAPQALLRAGHPQLAVALEQRRDWFGGDMFSNVEQAGPARQPETEVPGETAPDTAQEEYKTA
jgi:hypothetical protein